MWTSIRRYAVDLPRLTYLRASTTSRAHARGSSAYAVIGTFGLNVHDALISCMLRTTLRLLTSASGVGASGVNAATSRLADARDRLAIALWRMRRSHVSTAILVLGTAIAMYAARMFARIAAVLPANRSSLTDGSRIGGRPPDRRLGRGEQAMADDRSIAGGRRRGSRVPSLPADFLATGI